MESTITIETDAYFETEQDRQAYLYELNRHLGKTTINLTGHEASQAQAQNLTSSVNVEAQPYFAKH